MRVLLVLLVIGINLLCAGVSAQTQTRNIPLDVCKLINNCQIRIETLLKLTPTTDVLMDKSGSIDNFDATCKKKTGKTCWKLMVDFVDGLFNQLANITGGVKEEGLRLGILTFSCSNSNPIIKPLLNPASGDTEALAAAMVRLNNGNPSGGTCPSLGLGMIRDSIRNTAGVRPKAVLMITDGLIENADSAKSMNAGREIREQGAMMFTVSVGQPSTNADRQKQQNQLVGLSGDASRVFKTDEASALDKIVGLITALALDEFDASFSEKVLNDKNWCMSPNTSIKLSGPSVDHIQFGTEYAQSLLCTFFRDNQTIAETTASRETANGELSCAIPNTAFPAIYNSSTNRYERQAELGLTLFETSTAQRRSLRVRKLLILPITGSCVQLFWDMNRCESDPLEVEFQIQPTSSGTVNGVNCVMNYYTERIGVEEMLYANISVPATYDAGNTKFKCDIPISSIEGAVTLESFSIVGPQISVEKIRAFPDYSPCYDVKVDSEGCYGANVAFTFDISDQQDESSYSLSDGRKCYFQDRFTGSYVLVQRTAGTTCSIPPFSAGNVVLTGANDMVIFKESFDGSAPAYDVDCFSFFVENANRECISSSEPVTIGFEGRAIETLNTIFTTEEFFCRFALLGTSFEATPVQKGSIWTCLYPDIMESLLLDRRFTKVSLVRSSNSDIIFQSALNPLDQELCIDLSADSGNGQLSTESLDACWGDSKAGIVLSGESVELLRTMAEIRCAFSLDIGGERTTLYSPVAFSQSHVSCALPAAFTEDDVQLTSDRLLEVEIVVKAGPTTAPATVASREFQFILKGCTQLSPAGEVRACWGSAQPVPFRITQAQKTLTAAEQRGFTTFTCEFHDADEGLISSSSLTVVSNTGSQDPMRECVPSSKMFMQQSINQQKSFMLRIVASKTSKRTIVESYIVPLVVTEQCLQIRPSALQVCWGDSWYFQVGTNGVQPPSTSVSLMCDFNVGPSVPGVVSQDKLTWSCPIDSRAEVQPSTVSMRWGQYQVVSAKSVTRPPLTYCIEAEEVQGDGVACAGSSAAWFKLTGNTVKALSSSDEFVVCVFSNDGADEERVRGRFSTEGGLALICKSPTWMVWDEDGNYQQTTSYNSLKVVTGFSNQIIYSRSIEKSHSSSPQGGDGNGSSCVFVSYSTPRPECLHSDDVETEVVLTGDTISFLVQSAESRSWCEFSDQQGQAKVVVTPVYQLDNLTLTCRLLNREAAGRKLDRMRLLVPQRLQVDDDESPDQVVIHDSTVTLQSKECYSVQGVSIPDTLCAPGTRNETLAISGPSTILFPSGPIDCWLRPSDFPDYSDSTQLIVLDGYAYDNEIVCRGIIDGKVTEEWSASKIDLVISGHLIQSFPSCKRIVPLGEAPVKPSTDADSSAAVAGGVVSVFLVLSVFGVLLVYQKRRNSRAGNNFVMEDPISEANRQTAAVRRVAKSSGWNFFRKNSEVVALSPMMSAPPPLEELEKPPAITQSVNLDAPPAGFPYNIVQVPEWVMEFVNRRPFTLYPLLPKQDSSDNAAAMQINVRFEEDREAWGVQDILQDPVTVLPGDLIRVCVDPSNGLGMSIGRTAQGAIVVERFTPLKEVPLGPIETLGVVWVGDQLMEINDQSVKGWSLSQCSRAIRAGMKNSQISFAFKSSVVKSFLGFGAYQVIVPRGVSDLGLNFLSRSDLVVASVNRFGPLRNVVTVGSRLTAVDGVPVADEREVKSKLANDGIINTPTARLRFEAPPNPRRGADRPPLSPYAYT